jgi:MazG family protein
VPNPSQETEGFAGLVRLMDRLREPGGCPWDREQTYESLRGYLLEEAYEVAEALDQGDSRALGEELGDLLFQIVFLSRLAKEQGAFTIDDVVRTIAEKMVRRHPHVFGDVKAESSAQVLQNWEAIKREEKAASPRPAEASLLDGIPAALPALLKAQRLGSKAARVGFDWKEPQAVLAKTREELEELSQAVSQGDRDRVREELGDLLFVLAMLARHMEIDPEGALERANRKFRERFCWIEAELSRRGVPLEQAGLELLEQLWSQAKQRLRPA